MHNVLDASKLLRLLRLGLLKNVIGLGFHTNHQYILCITEKRTAKKFSHRVDKIPPSGGIQLFCVQRHPTEIPVAAKELNSCLLSFINKPSAGKSLLRVLEQRLHT